MDLSIIVVSYNTSRLLQDCLKSIYQAIDLGKCDKTCELIVIDNASTDDSVIRTKKNFPDIRLIQNKHNLGFASANNQGILLAKGEYVLLLNSDTKIGYDTLIKLLIKAKSDPQIVAVGGKLLNPDGSIQPSTGYFPNLLRVMAWMCFIDDLPILSSLIHPYHIGDKKIYKKCQSVDWVSGACILVKKEAIKKAGMLDEKIFMYGEEVEWCFRLKERGKKIIYTPEAVILHYKGESSGQKMNAGIIDEYKSILYFYQKHKSTWQLTFVKLALIFGALLRIILFGIIMRNPRKAALYAKAIKLVR